MCVRADVGPGVRARTQEACQCACVLKWVQVCVQEHKGGVSVCVRVKVGAGVRANKEKQIIEAAHLFLVLVCVCVT